MAKSAQTRIDEIDAAITAVMQGGQSYMLPDGTQVSRANLAWLQSMRDQALRDLAGETSKPLYRPIATPITGPGVA